MTARQLQHELNNERQTVDLLLNVLIQWQDGQAPVASTQAIIDIAKKQGRIA